jgi:membrane protein YdbS with pleckstrin-like domain
MNIRSIINVPLLLIATVVMIAGYVLLGIAPIDNHLSCTIAPIVLVVCYLVLIPLAIVTQKTEVKEKQ